MGPSGYTPPTPCPITALREILSTLLPLPRILAGMTSQKQNLVKCKYCPAMVLPDRLAKHNRKAHSFESREPQPKHLSSLGWPMRKKSKAKRGPATFVGGGLPSLGKRRP
jgi:hypothetical protein